MDIGLGIDTETWRIRIGFRSMSRRALKESLRPGIEESGSSMPAQYFDTPYGAHYWLWSWLWFTVHYSAVGAK